MKKTVRKAVIAGNWKMNKTRPEAKALLEELKQYSQQSIDYELKKEFANTQKASLLYTDIQKNQHKFQYYTPKAKQQFLNKIMDLKELKDYMPKEAIEKMQETTKNISKQLENGLTR